MSAVRIHPYLESGVLKMRVDRITGRGVQTLNPDGTWRDASLYEKDNVSGIPVSTEAVRDLLIPMQTSTHNLIGR